MGLKTIVIGLDGLSPHVVDAMFDDNALPNLARLRAQGGYARVATTSPAQTPVAWSTFATGVNPGVHGIFDFLRRDAKRYRPDLGLSRYEQRSAFLPPRAINLRSGRTIWDVLSEEGIPSTIIRCPCTYPAEPLHGRLLSGMGVPDVKGGIGTSTFFSTQPEIAREGETCLMFERDGEQLRAHLPGPRLPRGHDSLVALALRSGPDGTGVLTLGNRGPTCHLRVGEWSEWTRVKFKTGALTSMRGMVRFYLRSLAPHVELYASPVNFDPHAPPFPISHPWSYAASLEGEIGPYSTLGMPEDHTGLSNGRFDEDAFLAACDLVMREREAMLHYELSRLEHGLLYCLFDTPDRIQHMFWRFREPDHPANARHGHDPRFRRVIEDHYRRCDDVVGEVLRAVDDETTVMVVSDHGFTGFRRAINLNAWLVDAGWMALRPDADRGDASDFFRGVDWSRTRAYALGFGGIYLNVAGREGEGIVPDADRADLSSRLARELTGLADVEHGTQAIAGVDVRERLYAGPRAAEAPDLVVRAADGYRVSWSTALGGVPLSWFEDNTRKWAGDHIVDPVLVPGVLFMNRPMTERAPHLVDCASTILASLGVRVPAAFEGQSVLRAPGVTTTTSASSY